MNAHVMMLLARTTPEDQVKTKAEGLTLFAIPMDRTAKGLEVRKIDKMGGNSVDSNEVWFDDYIVPGDTVIGDEAGLGKGFRMILHGMNAERCLVAAEALGIGYAALAKAAEYAGSRVVFGRPIGQNQGIAHPLADAWAQLHGAACAVYHATRLYDAGLKDKTITPIMVGTAANTAKMLAAEASFNACQRAILAHGGMGYAKEFDVERMLRESFIPRIAPISREMVLNYIAERVLSLPKSY
jgi:acyl-CoA dehydrogenase